MTTDLLLSDDAAVWLVAFTYMEEDGLVEPRREWLDGFEARGAGRGEHWDPFGDVMAFFEFTSVGKRWLAEQAFAEEKVSDERDAEQLKRAVQRHLHQRRDEALAEGAEARRRLRLASAELRRRKRDEKRLRRAARDSGERTE